MQSHVPHHVIVPPIRHVSSHNSRLYAHRKLPLALSLTDPSCSAPAPSCKSPDTPLVALTRRYRQKTSAHSSRTIKMMIMLLISALFASGVAFAPLPYLQRRVLHLRLRTCSCFMGAAQSDAPNGTSPRGEAVWASTSAARLGQATLPPQCLSPIVGR